MKKSIRIVIIFLLFFILAQQNCFALGQGALLNVSPKVCVISEKVSMCDLNLRIMWQLAETQNICLYENGKKVKCWQQNNQAKMTHKAQVQIETVYSLVNTQTGKILAKTKVEVQSSHLKTQRRRLRSPWSFF
ncbi:DUF3019 domain-containing protein [Pseudoalteromonas denitrificans]|uniref:DUF3019 domain-containing protein n=1 Tax=Pseudoalteromonas denitrificans DSM 6059 TaxID=1123010 RepID=A0A1I1EVK4_9GAMM|nr:DUF3019 domain-containing protein [Pseudoalteromonas denitrificans]SFB91144.1 Protein of unknown function [Pseudoalteromonas denitrificans DSM 6059]